MNNALKQFAVTLLFLFPLIVRADIVIVSQPAHGSVTVNGNSITYTAKPNWYGVTTFKYRARDSKGALSPVKVSTVTVNPVNDAPTGGNITYDTQEDMAQTKTVPTYDADGDATSILIVNGPDKGSVSKNGNKLTFNPPANWSGTTTFTYRVVDPSGAKSPVYTANVIVRPVNDAPTGENISFDTQEDVAQTKTVPIFDVEGDSTSIQIVSGPIEGTVQKSGNNITYTPPENWFGTTSFTYQVVDMAGAKSPVYTANVIVRSVNDAPTGENISFDTQEDIAQTKTVPTFDVDGDDTSLSIVSVPGKGTASVTGNNLTYTPPENWFGTTSITYQVVDMAGAKSPVYTANVVVRSVNDAPTISQVSFSLDEDNNQSKEVHLSDVEGDEITLRIESQPLVGSVMVNERNIIYTPPANWNGATSFEYKAEDSKGAISEIKTASVTVKPVNDPPASTDIFLSAEEDNKISSTISVSDVDIGMPFDSHTVEIISMPTNGSLKLTAMDFTYTPLENWYGTDTFTYQIVDSAGAKSPVYTATLTITSVNDTPSISSLQFRMMAGQANSQVLTVNDPDIGDEHTIIISREASSGLLDIEKLDKNVINITYTPNSDWYGADTFQFAVIDNEGQQSNFAEASIAVYPYDAIHTDSGDKLSLTLDDQVVIIGNMAKHAFEQYQVNAVFNNNLYELPYEVVKTENEPSTGIPIYWELSGDYSKSKGNNIKSDMAATQIVGGSYPVTLTRDGIEALNETLKYVAVDSSGSTDKGTIIGVGAESTAVEIPAVQNEVFSRTNGDPVFIVQDVHDQNAERLTSIEDVFLKLSSSAPHSIIINGVEINPGETRIVESSKDFSLDHDVKYPVELTANTESDYQILLTTSDMNTRPVKVAIRAWSPNVIASVSNSDPVQIFDDVLVKLDKASQCNLSESVDTVKKYNLIDSPVCLVEWDNIPSGIRSLSKVNVISQNRLQGYLNHSGQHEIEYDISIFNGNKKIIVKSGSITLNTLSVADHVELVIPESSQSVKALIEKAEITLDPVGNSKCSLTVNDTQASEFAETRPSNNKPMCLVKWEYLPSPLQQEPIFKHPWAVGIFSEFGTKLLRWKISVFNQLGEEYLINEQNQTMEVLPPEPPSIQLNSLYCIKDNETVMVVPMGESRPATVRVESENADLIYNYERDGRSIQSEKIYGGWGTGKFKFTKNLKLGDSPKLWEKSSLNVKAYYELAPELSAVLNATTFVGPPKSVGPVASLYGSSDNSVLNNDEFQVDVDITSMYRPDDGYDASTMGDWEIRLHRQVGRDRQPITDWKDITDGRATFMIDAAEYSEDDYLKIYSEARLKLPDDSDLDGYEYIVFSNRALNVVILRAEAIEGYAETRKLSGRAPFRAIVRLKVDDYDLYRALGSVTWELSRDNQKTWESFEKTGYDKNSFSEIFPVGIYYLRAKTINTNSGAAAYTPTLEINSYDMVDLSIEGPSIKFIGEDATYKATTTVNEEPGVHGENVVIQWSTDRGETYIETDKPDTLVVDGSEAGRTYVYLRAKTKQAPETDLSAWKLIKRSVEFRKVKAPRIYVFGPTTAELGKPYVYNARASLPYPGMDNTVSGAFIMPNGDRVNSLEATFIPDENDVIAERVEITYEAWVDGWEDKGGIGSYGRRIRVWEYLWPSFNLSYTKTASVVPADINASIRPLSFTGALDNPVYDWVLPPNAVEKEGSSVDYVMPFTITEPGDYDIQVTVSDARGNSTTENLSLSFTLPEPYSIDLTATTNNLASREPLDISLRPYISGGHPRDRVESYTYSMNGEVISEGSLYSRVEDLPAGSYTFDFEMKTEFGEELTAQKSIDVAQNIEPVCNITSRETIGSYIFYADCSDEDGRIRRYEWIIDGEERTLTADRVSVSKTADMEPFDVHLRGKDDADAYSPQVSITTVP